MALVTFKRKVALSNPAKGTRPRPRIFARKKRNVGEIVALSLANPKKGVSPVAKTKRKAGRPHKSHSSKRPRYNPAGSKKGRRHHRRRRNPSHAGGMVGLFEQAGFAIGGAAGSKYLAQMILGTNNSGIMGYAANLAIGFVLGKAVEMFTKNAQFANATILGAVIATMTRALLDNTSLGTTIGLSGVGDYVAQATIIPPTLKPGTRFTYANPWERQTQQMISGAIASLPPAPAAAAAGMGRIGQSSITRR